jgi:peroxiredoxin Q/BCP
VALNEGDPAPDFDLETDTGRVRLSDLKGGIVVLYFYPKDDTPGCTKEAIGFSERKAEFDALGATVVGVSKDSARSHGKFREKYGLNLVLGSSPDNDMLERYGVWIEKSMYGRTYMGIDRATFLIGADGRVRRVWRKVKVPGHVESVLEAVAASAG